MITDLIICTSLIRYIVYFNNCDKISRNCIKYMYCLIVFFREYLSRKFYSLISNKANEPVRYVRAKVKYELGCPRMKLEGVAEPPEGLGVVGSSLLGCHTGVGGAEIFPKAK